MDTTNKQAHDSTGDGENSVAEATEQNALAAVEAVHDCGTAVVKLRTY